MQQASISTQTVSPAKSINGLVALPGDKSISHRYGMISAIAEGKSTIANYSTGADCQSTLACMAQLGAKIGKDAEGRVVVEGGALREAARDLDHPLLGARLDHRVHHSHAVGYSGRAAVHVAHRRG